MGSSFLLFVLDLSRCRCYGVRFCFGVLLDRSHDNLVDLVVIDVNDFKSEIAVIDTVRTFRNLTEHVHHKAGNRFVSRVFRQAVDHELRYPRRLRNR